MINNHKNNDIFVVLNTRFSPDSYTGMLLALDESDYSLKDEKGVIFLQKENMSLLCNFIDFYIDRGILVEHLASKKTRQECEKCIHSECCKYINEYSKAESWLSCNLYKNKNGKTF